jgi:DNA-binding CsgD family transcriptional regulator
MTGTTGTTASSGATGAALPRRIYDRERRHAAAVAELTAAGWGDRAGLQLPAQPWDVADRGWLCHGSVGDEQSAGWVLVAAARGAAVVALCVDEDLRRRLVTDLARVGPVQVEVLGRDPLEVLDGEQRQLLELLAEGRSIGDAAAVLYLSPRTAERRVATVRAALGVRTTAEAIAMVPS